MKADIITKIDPNKLYNTTSIIDGGYILNRSGKPADRKRIYKLIQMNRIPARNIGMSNRLPFWAVKGSDLIDFIKKNYL